MIKSLSLASATLFSVALSVGLAAQPLMIAQAGSDPRMGFASNLIYRSTAAQQIEASNDPKAAELHQRAKSLYEQAQELEGEDSKKALDEALKVMFEAVKSAEPAEVREAKDKADYDKKLESVQALLKAFDAVAAEKKADKIAKQTHAEVDNLIVSAQQLHDRKLFTQGKGVLEGALNTIKTNIEGLRGGDTLVRSLNFASKEEEYHYEVDRNDTHQMLVNVLLKEKREKSPSIAQAVDAALETALGFREKAEALAADGNYQEAIDQLDLSTKELVKAIRRGGVYIPG
ncbi:hypothetical protein D0544_09395 [Aestuariirhabdus litorea]|uniref:YfdX family protein n=1 Tax=Aestuariirhabdus litorea TaxID=2528527 RepID=A0A3P3VTG9_9GAMM|nr:hypothetical protein D0544_09395 [Aestuariirhabdus litorea]